MLSLSWLKKYFSPPLHFVFWVYSANMRICNFKNGMTLSYTYWISSSFNFFLYRCNNRGTYQNKWFPSNSWGFKKKTIPLFLMDNIKLDEIPSKIKQKCDCFILHHKFCRCFLKKLRDTATSPFISWCFTSAKNFIHHYQKKFFWHEFPFFNGFTPTPKPHPVNQNPQSVIIFFCWCPLI